MTKRKGNNTFIHDIYNEIAIAKADEGILAKDLIESLERVFVDHGIEVVATQNSVMTCAECSKPRDKGTFKPEY
jgi:hypothetical protein